VKYFQDGGGRHLVFVRTGNSAIRSSVPQNPTLEPHMKWIGRPVAEIWPFEFFQDGGGRHLGFFEPKIAPLDPPSLKTSH